MVATSADRRAALQACDDRRAAMQQRDRDDAWKVLLYLRENVNPFGQIVVSHKAIGAAVGLHRMRVSHACFNLRSWGYLTYELAERKVASPHRYQLVSA